MTDIEVFDSRIRSGRVLSLINALLLALAGGTAAMELFVPSLFFGFLLVIAFLALIVNIYLLDDSKQIVGLLSVLFAVIYAVLISFNYFTQLAISVRDIEQLSMFDVNDTNSLFWIIELLGYFFMGISTLLISPYFQGNVLAKIIQVLFILNFLLGLGGVVGYLFELDIRVMFAGLLVWNVIMPIAAIMIYFYLGIKSARTNT